MPHIALIGPIGAGKSTVAPLVGALLNRPVVDLDELRGDFYTTLDYDNAAADAALADGGVPALIKYWKPFEIALVEHVANLQPDAVLDFGAGHSHYDDESHARRAATALAPHHVVLLLPRADLLKSERILTARAPEEYQQLTRELNAAFLRSETNQSLADRVVVAGERTPDEVAVDIAEGYNAIS